MNKDKLMGCLNEEEFKIVDNMAKHGGSFIKALAVCFHHADVHNKRLLITTFPTYWAMYKPSKWDNSTAEQADQDYKEGKFTGDAELI